MQENAHIFALEQRAGKKRPNYVSPSMSDLQPSTRHLSNPELLPSFTLPLGFIWDLTPDMSRHCYNMEGTGAKQAVLKLS